MPDLFGNESYFVWEWRQSVLRPCLTGSWGVLIQTNMLLVSTWFLWWDCRAFQHNFTNNACLGAIQRVFLMLYLVCWQSLKFVIISFTDLLLRFWGYKSTVEEVDSVEEFCSHHRYACCIFEDSLTSCWSGLVLVQRRAIINLLMVGHYSSVLHATAGYWPLVFHALFECFPIIGHLCQFSHRLKVSQSLVIYVFSFHIGWNFSNHWSFMSSAFTLVESFSIVGHLCLQVSHRLKVSQSLGIYVSRFHIGWKLLNHWSFMSSAFTLCQQQW